MARRAWPRSGVRTRLPVAVWRRSDDFDPRSIDGLALWLDGDDVATLYTTDAGPVVPVTDPTQISGCSLWLDSSDLATITKDGSNLVSQWNDKSGNNRNATASGSNRPTHGSVTQNSLPLMSFDGTATQMQIASTFMVTSNVTIFAVARYNSGSFGAIITSKGTGDSSPALQHANGSWQISGAGGVSVMGTQASHSVLTGVVNSLATSGYANGLLIDSDAASGSLASDATVTSIGTYRQAVANVLNGTIAEIVAYNTALSTADRARVEAYLATKWGISAVHARATASSDPVGYWADKSGNARHATQATGASRPTVSGTLQNSRRTLAFDGSNDALVGTGAQSLKTGMTVVGAYYSGSVNYSSLFAVGDSAAGKRWLSGSSLGKVGVDFYTNAASVSASASQRTGVTSFSFSPSANSVGIRMDGAQVLSQSSLSPALAAFASDVYAVASVPSQNEQWLSGRLFELAVYNRVLSASELRRVEQYLASRWGVTLAPQVSNPDAQDWINRVYANGGTVSASTAAAVSAFCNAIDAESGLRACFYRLNPFAGGTSGTVAGLNASLVPLYRGPAFGGATFGGSVDTNTGGLFIPSDYSETAGLQGSGSKYLNTGLPMNFTAARNLHLCAVAGGFQLGNQSTLIAADTNGDGTSPRFYQGLVSFSGTPRINVFYNIGSGFSQAQVGNTYTNSMFVGSGNASGNTLYANGSSVGTDVEAGATANTNTYPLYVFANNNRNLATPLNIANCRISAYSAGLYMTPAQVSAYTAAMKTLQESLGRASW